MIFWGSFAPMDTKCQAGTTVVRRTTTPGLIQMFEDDVEDQSQVRYLNYTTVKQVLS